jgi:hypothetical protein
MYSTKVGKHAQLRASLALKREKIIGSIFLRMRVTIPGTHSRIKQRTLPRSSVLERLAKTYLISGEVVPSQGSVAHADTLKKFRGPHNS